MKKYTPSRQSENLGKVLKRPPFPINVKCNVIGLLDNPTVTYTGYIRKLKNVESCIFEYSEGYRLLNADIYGGQHTENLTIHIAETNEKWDFYR